MKSSSPFSAGFALQVILLTCCFLVCHVTAFTTRIKSAAFVTPSALVPSSPKAWKGGHGISTWASTCSTTRAPVSLRMSDEEGGVDETKESRAERR
eukprot:938675-Rhodomonas_salina.2